MPIAANIEWRRALRGEPTLSEVLSDPIIETIMSRDGVSRDDMRRLVQAYREAPQKAAA